MFDELYGQGFPEHDMDNNRVEEEILNMLKKMLGQADKVEILEEDKWK